MTLLEMKQAVADRARQAFDERLFAGTSGNLSLLDRDSGRMAITPSSVPYPGMGAGDIMVITLDGQVIEGPHRPSSEWPMHAQIYKALPQVSGIVHTHSPCATGFAVTHDPIPVILIEMMFFLLGDVPVAEYRAPGSPLVGVEAAKVLKNRGACLLANHGVTAVGGDLDEAYLRAVYVEDAARIYTNARLVGVPKVIPLEEQNEMRRRMGVPEESQCWS